MEVETEFVALMEVVVEHRGEQVVGRRDGVEVAGEMEVERLHRDHLAVAASRCSTLDPERRSHGRLAQGHGGPLAQLREGVTEPHRHRRLALAERGGSGRRDEDVLGPRCRLQLVDRRQLDLGDVAPVRHEMRTRDAHSRRDVSERCRVAGPCDLKIGGERHGWMGPISPAIVGRPSARGSTSGSSAVGPTAPMASK